MIIIDQLSIQVHWLQWALGDIYIYIDSNNNDTFGHERLEFVIGESNQLGYKSHLFQQKILRKYTKSTCHGHKRVMNNTKNETKYKLNSKNIYISR